MRPWSSPGRSAAEGHAEGAFVLRWNPLTQAERRVKAKNTPEGARDRSRASGPGTGASRIIGGDPVNARPGERAHHGRGAPGFRAKQGQRERRKALARTV